MEGMYVGEIEHKFHRTLLYFDGVNWFVERWEGSLEYLRGRCGWIQMPISRELADRYRNSKHFEEAKFEQGEGR
jgi:hypothetical protein